VTCALLITGTVKMLADIIIKFLEDKGFSIKSYGVQRISMIVVVFEYFRVYIHIKSNKIRVHGQDLNAGDPQFFEKLLDVEALKCSQT